MSALKLFRYSIFLVFIIAVLLVDLLLVGRTVHVISMNEATIWSIIWISLGMAFYFVILYFSHLLHGIETKEELLEIANKYNPYLKFQSSTFSEMLQRIPKVAGYQLYFRLFH